MRRIPFLSKSHLRFGVDFGTLLAGAGGAQAITLLASPVVSRLFTPEDFGAATFFLTQKLAFPNIDKAIDLLYRFGGRLFFSKIAQAIYLFLSIAGFIAFIRVLENPELEFVGDDYARGLALIWLASILPVLIHELGHALTVKHYNREVGKGGVMIYFGMPAALRSNTAAGGVLEMNVKLRSA